jgi:hypothetical protein
MLAVGQLNFFVMQCNRLFVNMWICGVSVENFSYSATYMHCFCKYNNQNDIVVSNLRQR